MAKAKKSKAKKSKVKKSKARIVKAKKAARKAVKSRAPARKSKKTPARKAAPKAAKPAPRKAKKTVKKKQIVGEGDYAASKKFLKDQADFVRNNKGKIADMGRQAEQALDGPEGQSLRQAEQDATSHSMPE